MNKLTLTKPDGRRLHLYSRRPLPGGLVARSPEAAPLRANPHLRWHPLRGEWVVYASHRQERTFLPPPEYDPLLPSDSADAPTELPVGDYDAAVFDNLFPSLVEHAHDAPGAIVPTRPAVGAAEVVVFTQDPGGSLGQLPTDEVELVLEVWADRYLELGARPEIQYVLPFENRGVEVGATLHHPHGQLYAYPFVPPIPARELEEAARFLRREGKGPLQDLIEREVADGRRVLYAGPHALAFVPVCARYAYEVWVAPTRPAPSLAALSPAERRDLALALKAVLLKYDGLWGRPMPYVLVVHQAPTDGQEHPEAHVHLELYPPSRSADRLKFLAGTELGAGTFASDSLPEEKARELQAVDVSEALR